jgi:hypothetical protein
MTTPFTDAVLKSGIITPAMLREMKRFSAVIPRDAEVSEPVPLDLAVQYIADAMQSESLVLVRETDLTALKQYSDTALPGILWVGDTPIDVTYGRTPLGEYIVAWKGESIAEMLTDPSTYLVPGEGTVKVGEGSHNVYFKDVRELFFGGQKAFMVCIPHGN